SSSSASKVTRRYTDNGAGGILENGKLIPAATINYDTGAVNLGPVLRSRTVDTYTSRNTVEKGSSKTVTEQIDGKVSVYYIQSYDDFTEKTLRTVIHSANLRILDPEKNGELVPRSLVLNIDGDLYYEHNGKIIGNYSCETGIGEDFGTINMATGEIS